MSLWIGMTPRNLFNSRALDSLREGKRMIEAKYAIIRHEVIIQVGYANLQKQPSMYEILRDKEKSVIDRTTNSSSEDGSS
jgi:hypothetical protein